MGTQIIPAGIENAADIERSIAEIGREANGGLIVMPDSITLIHRKLIVSLAERYRLPAIYQDGYVKKYLPPSSKALLGKWREISRAG